MMVEEIKLLKAQYVLYTGASPSTSEVDNSCRDIFLVEEYLFFVDR